MPATHELNLRDPFVLPLPEEGCYYLFGTPGAECWENGRGFPVYVSRDLERWDGPFPALTPPADFAWPRHHWSPEVHRRRGRYYLFATFANADASRRGTHVWVAGHPRGPFRTHSDGPVTPSDWLCLDGTLYVDGQDRPWMVFCHEWLQCRDGEILALPLTDDLSAAAGEPLLLFRASQAPGVKGFTPGSGPAPAYVTDGPFLFPAADGGLWMLWSSGGPGGYAQFLARSDHGVEGPWRFVPEPLFTRDGGHGMVFDTFDGQRLLTLHRPNSHLNERPLFLPLREADGRLTVVTDVHAT